MKYLDTSAFIKYYCNPAFEKGIDAITNLIEQAKQGKEALVTSILTLGEIVSAFDRWIRIKAITEQEFSQLITRFFVDIELLHTAGGLIIESITSLSIVFSVEHIIKHHLPINDSLHLYTALALRFQIEQFISSDAMQLRTAEREGLPTWNPELWIYLL